jgi:hypothetical protein
MRRRFHVHRQRKDVSKWSEAQMAGEGNSKMDEIGRDVFSSCESWKFNPTDIEGGLWVASAKRPPHEAEVQPPQAEVPQTYRLAARHSGRRVGHFMGRSAPGSLVQH